MACCIHGYHVYQDIWAAVVGEVLECSREPTNEVDRYAMAVIKYEVVIRHLPQSLKTMFSVFKKRRLYSDWT